MSSQTYVALLRGINVGGNNKISMTDLKACFEEAGFTDVVTRGNSGNVIFTADKVSSIKLEPKIETALEKTFKIPVSTLVRNETEIAKVIDAIPKSWSNDPKRKYDIIFLKQVVDNPKIVDQIGPHPSVEDLIYIPGTLFWSVLKKDFSKSNFPKLIGTNTYKGMTIRTLGVVRKIYELMKSD